METEAGPARHFGPRLRPGESILWAGQPDPNRWVTTFDAVLIPFSLVWGGMAVGAFGVFQGWWGSSSPTRDPGAQLVATLFLAVGLYMVFGRFLHKSYKKKRTFYAVTDQRVLYLARRRLGDKLYAIALEDVERVAGEETVVDGCGSLTCARSWDPGVGGLWDWQRDLFCMWADSSAVLLYDVDDALELRDWILRLRAVPQEERSGSTFPPRR